MMKKILPVMAMVMAIQVGFAQNEVDALRYSAYQFGGSARYTGMAGAFGALGGDMSVLSTNPAGMARFTKSEFGLGFSFNDAQTDSYFNSSSATNGRGNFGLSNIGFVGANTRGLKGDWKSVQFGIAYNKLANFWDRSTISGTSESSLLDVFAGDASGVPEGNLLDDRPFTSGPAYWAYLIDPLDTVNHTYSTQIPTGTVDQERITSRRGSVSETSMAFSGNYRDKLLVGLSMGFPSIRFEESYSHHEEVNDTSLNLSEFTYRQNLITRGMGFNIKLGAIFQPVEWARVGIAFNSASTISMSDRWDTNISSSFKDGTAYSEESPLGSYNYNLKLPSRWIFSSAFIIGKYGVVSADYELVNYSNARFRNQAFGFDNYDFAKENAAIDQLYTATSNIRLGTEWRINPFLIRGGYAFYGNPFGSGQTSIEQQRTAVTAGIGYRNKYFYFDLSAQLWRWSESNYLYDPTIADEAKLDHQSTVVSASFGFRF